ncbi:hypothetical protein B0H14DRAFT_3152748 [Mycena olivaceomarginata]|nr:hypothetical protein B0H14DRAFT_3152748 [Mycena olivaceomarginata]
MANPQNSEKEKEWKGLKLTPIVEDEDGLNNYSEFKAKATLDLDAAGYWKYIAGPEYNPPIIPNLMASMQVQGLDAAGNLANFTMPGNEAVVNAAKKNTEVWLLADKKAHALIVKAVPSARLYLVRNCKSAHDAWMALKREYEPPNALTAITIKQQIIAYRCDASEDPVNWRQHLVTLMSSSDKWRYCRDALREKVRQGDAMQNPVSSTYVISRLKEEEVEMQIAPSIGRRRARAAFTTSTAGAEAPNAYAAGPSGQSLHQNGRRNDKVNQRQAKHPVTVQFPATSRTAAVLRRTCSATPPLAITNGLLSRMAVERLESTPRVSVVRKDVHLAPEARIAARRKQALEANGGHFAGMVEDHKRMETTK